MIGIHVIVTLTKHERVISGDTSIYKHVSRPSEKLVSRKIRSLPGGVGKV